MILDVLLIIGLVFGIRYFQKKAAEREEAKVSAEDLSRRYVETIRHGMKNYALKRHMTTVLLIGTDNSIYDNKQSDMELFYNYNVADFLVILAFDHSQKTVTPFQICRDTMCDVPWLSVNGLVGGTEVEQIALAHTYGSGKEDSCVNTRNAVSSLLFGLPIDHYLAFTMDTVPLVNDLVGGVTVTLEDSIPALGEDYVKGAAITLKGGASLRFVRYRDTSLLDGNLARMARQRQYLDAFTLAARKELGEKPDLVTDGFKLVEKYICTDLSVENISNMISNLSEYELLSVITPSGRYAMGEKYPEFYVEDKSLWSCVQTTFCE